jgi:ribosomal-protein-alanine N-acetyltransferase
MRSTIRRAKADDAARLRALQAELTEPAPALLDAAIPQSDDTRTELDPTRTGINTTRTETDATHRDGSQPTPDALAATPAAFTLLVSVDDDDVAVGYLLAVRGESTHLAELVVDPRARRGGRATALLSTLIEQHSHPITVHVAADNTAARELYRSMGFQEQARSDDQFDHAAGVTLRYPGER